METLESCNADESVLLNVFAGLVSQLVKYERLGTDPSPFPDTGASEMIIVSPWIIMAMCFTEEFWLLLPL